MRSGGEHVVRRRLADGSVKEYRYARNKAPKPPRISEDSLGALTIAYRSSPEWAALRPATKVNYTHYLKDLEKIHQVPVAEVKRRNLIQIRNLIAEGRGLGAAQVFVRVAQALFTWALDADLIESTPAIKIKALPGGHLRAWTTAEADYAEKLLPEELRRVIVLARHTGQRRGDLCAMTWAAYDGQKIRLKQQKTGTTLVVQCPRTLRAELDAWKASATATRILTTRKGLPWVAQRLSMMLPAALLKIGMDEGLNVHGLRKLAAASLAHAGCSTNEIAAITGHKTLSMVQFYTASADQERLADAAIVRLENGNVKSRKTTRK